MSRIPDRATIEPQEAKRPGFRRQLDILFDRNLTILLAAPGTLAVFLIQPPLIGYLIGLAWKSATANRTTYFILALSMIYLGCMNACTAIVKERAIYSRERMIGLNLWAYLLSKLQLMTLVSFIQALLVLVVTAHHVQLHGGHMRHALLLTILTLTGVTASSLGLAVSAFARTTYVAVIMIPMLVLPQIIFSEVVLGSRFDSNLLSTIGKFTITKWCYDSLVSVAFDWEWTTLLGSQVVLGLMATGFVFLCALRLRLEDW